MDFDFDSEPGRRIFGLWADAFRLEADVFRRPGSEWAARDQDDETFGVSRMYEAQATEAGTMAIFRSRDEALTWLGLSPEDVPGDEG